MNKCPKSRDAKKSLDLIRDRPESGAAVRTGGMTLQELAALAAAVVGKAGGMAVRCHADTAAGAGPAGSYSPEAAYLGKDDAGGGEEETMALGSVDELRSALRDALADRFVVPILNYHMTSLGQPPYDPCHLDHHVPHP